MRAHPAIAKIRQAFCCQAFQYQTERAQKHALESFCNETPQALISVGSGMEMRRKTRVEKPFVKGM
jgi:hypothetical protein